MMYVAYNAYGDLIAADYSLAEVLRAIEAAGYCEDECLIVSEDECLVVRVTP